MVDAVILIRFDRIRFGCDGSGGGNKEFGIGARGFGVGVIGSVLLREVGCRHGHGYGVAILRVRAEARGGVRGSEDDEGEEAGHGVRGHG